MRPARCPVVIVLLLLTAAAPAAATAVHKCRLVDGRIVYQSAGCAPGERTLATWEAIADPPATQAPQPRVASTRGPARARAPARRRSAAASESRVDSCSAAKERRDAIERRVGLSRTYELLSALQREVYDACR